MSLAIISNLMKRLLLFALLASTSARADTWFSGTRLLNTTYYEVSLTYGQGATWYDSSGALPLTGIRLHERHGVVGGFLSAALIAIGLATPYASGKVEYDTQSSSTESRSENGFTETYTTTYVEHHTLDFGPGRQMSDGDRENMNETVGDAFNRGWLDVTLFAEPLFTYSRPGGGNGIDLAFGVDRVLGRLLGQPVVLDYGAHFASVGTSMRRYEDAGGLVRIHVPVWRGLTLTAEVDLNVIWLVDAIVGALVPGAPPVNIHPLTAKAGAELHLTDRFFARGEGLITGLGPGATGFMLTGGFRL